MRHSRMLHQTIPLDCSTRSTLGPEPRQKARKLVKFSFFLLFSWSNYAPRFLSSPGSRVFDARVGKSVLLYRVDSTPSTGRNYQDEIDLGKTKSRYPE